MSVMKKPPKKYFTADRSAVMVRLLAALVIATTTALTGAQPGRSASKDLKTVTSLLNRQRSSEAQVRSDYEQALAMLGQLLDAYPDAQERDPAMFLVAHAYWGLQRPDSARTAIASYLAHHPSGRYVPTARFLNAQLDWESGLVDSGLSRMTQVIDTYADALQTAELRLMAARSMITAGRFRDAQTQLEAIVTLDSPGWARAAAEPILVDVRLAGQPAPSFSGVDVDGDALALSDFYGSVVLLDFWASWCGPCRQTIPHLKQLYSRYASQGFKVVGVSLDNSAGALRRFKQKFRIPWRSHFDGRGWRNQVARMYGVTSIPKSYLLDRQGRIIAFDLRNNDLDRAVAAALSNQ